MKPRIPATTSPPPDADPAAKAPGMVYGGVTVHGGRLFVVTCNLEGPNRGMKAVVACVGAK